MASIEICRQSVPVMGPEINGPINPGESEPLHQLAEHAPYLPDREYDPGAVRHPFSNDESAQYFDQTQARTLTGEYQEAGNRTALVIGESSLSSSIRYIPEDTIVIVDNELEMCLFMRQYVEGLHKASNLAEWQDFMGLNRPGFMDRHGERFSSIINQLHEWEENGYAHGLLGGSEDAFQAAKKAADEKAIIPWHADITDEKQMKQLAAALDAHGATITMMNLSNALTYDQRKFKDTSEYADVLGCLPVTASAPILTTSFNVKYPMRDTTIVEATGPFFGLDNLAEHGGSTKEDAPGPIAERQYLRRGPTASFLGNMVVISFGDEADGSFPLGEMFEMEDEGQVSSQGWRSRLL